MRTRRVKNLIDLPAYQYLFLIGNDMYIYIHMLSIYIYIYKNIFISYANIIIYGGGTHLTNIYFPCIFL